MMSDFTASVFSVSPALAVVLHWAVGIPALLVMFYPLDALLPAGVQQRSLEQVLAARSEVGLRPWRWQVLWLLEPVRAFGGAWLLQSVFQSNAHTAWAPAFDISLACGVVLQLWTKRAPLTAWAPIGYCAGLVIFLLPWWAAPVVLVGGVAGMLWLRTWSGFFLAGVAVLAAAAVLPSLRTDAAFAICLLALPLCARVLFHCRLVLPSRG
jgi:hypothetical protein